MPQIFKPRADLILRFVFLTGCVGIFGGGAVAWMIRDSTYNTEVGVAYSQPIPFSHKHHAGDLGIDCRYCHTSVDKAAFAGMPTTHTCMSCHSQIWTDSPLLSPLVKSDREGRRIEWSRVYRLPDYVYFNHAIHIKRKVSCQTCHGDVRAMPLTMKNRPFTMKDCLQCHNHPEPYVPAARRNDLNRCYTCHR